MHLIQNLRSRIIILLVFFFLLLSLSSTQAAPKEWHDGWSNPINIRHTERLYEYEAAATNDLVWLVSYASKLQHFQLDKVGLDGDIIASTEVAAIEGDMVSYTLATSGKSVNIVWLEQALDSTYIVKRAHVNLDMQVTNISTVYRSPGSIKAVDAVCDQQGKLYVAWDEMYRGYYDIYLQIIDRGKSILSEAVSISDNKLMKDTNPHLSVDSNGIVHCVYLSQEFEMQDMVYRRYDTASGELGTIVVLGRVSADEEHTAVPLSRPDGAADIIWRKASFIRGGERNLTVVRGVTDANGVVQEFKPITGRTAYMAEVSAVQGKQGLFAAWISEINGPMQLDTAFVGDTGETLSQGLATVGYDSCFKPQPLFVGENKAIIYYQIADKNSIAIKMVTDIDPAEPSLAFELGLDLERPIIDALFKYMNFYLGAAVVSLFRLLAVGLAVAIISLLDRSGVFSDTLKGTSLRLLIFFVVLWITKLVGQPIYYMPQHLVTWLEVLSLVGSALFAIGFLFLSNFEKKSPLSLLITGYMFVFCDALGSFMVKGVGLW